MYIGTMFGSAMNVVPGTSSAVPALPSGPTVVAGLMVVLAARAGAPQPIVVACCADRNGLSQLMVEVSRENRPPGAICATERTSVNISWVYRSANGGSS